MNFLRVLTFVSLLTAIAGCGGPKSSPVASAGSKKDQGAGEQGTEAKSLIAAFKEDRKAATEKYEGKVLTVKGAKLFGTSQAGGAYNLMLEGGAFSCAFRGAHAEKAKKLKAEGEPTVNFKGKLGTTAAQGDKTIFFFEDCELLD